jgi:flagellar protein FliT
MSFCERQLHCYEQMAPLTERMLALARSEQWAALGPLEAQFSALAEQVRLLEDCGCCGDHWFGRGAELHATIQANHEAVRALVLPEMARLAASLRSMEWQQSLQNAYSRPDHALL